MNGAIGVVGATGAVGREALAILCERGHGERIAAFGSERAAGREVACGGRSLRVQAASEESLAACEAVLLCTPAEVSRRLGPSAAAAGAVVIDNSSAFRMAADVPLIVPEINGAGLTGAERLIANPNCSTIILLAALEPLRRRFGVARIVVSTYQAVSGAGQAAMEELREQAGRALRGREAGARVFHEPCAFNVFSHDSAVEPGSGLNGEERKIIEEARRIWNDADLCISPTCVRVPVMRAHAEAIMVELGEWAREDEVREELRRAPWLEVIDDRENNRFPTPLRATGRDEVLVGRVRRDPGSPARGERSRGFLLFACADQLRKGAALNAVQIMELMLRRAERRDRPRPASLRR